VKIKPDVQAALVRLIEAQERDHDAGDSREFEPEVSKAYVEAMKLIPCPQCKTSAPSCGSNRRLMTITLWSHPENLHLHARRWDTFSNYRNRVKVKWENWVWDGRVGEIETP
jgi:hypothetical protein